MTRGSTRSRRGQPADSLTLGVASSPTAWCPPNPGPTGAHGLGGSRPGLELVQELGSGQEHRHVHTGSLPRASTPHPGPLSSRPHACVHCTPTPAASFLSPVLRFVLRFLSPVLRSDPLPPRHLMGDACWCTRMGRHVLGPAHAGLQTPGSSQCRVGWWVSGGSWPWPRSEPPTTPAGDRASQTPRSAQTAGGRAEAKVTTAAVRRGLCAQTSRHEVPDVSKMQNVSPKAVCAGWSRLTCFSC